MDTEETEKGKDKYTLLLTGYWAALVAGLISGVLLTLCLPFLRLWPLVFLALSPFLAYLAWSRDYKHAALCGSSFGFFMHAISMYWLWHIAPGLNLVLAVEKAILPALAACAIVWFRRRLGTAPRVCAATPVPASSDGVPACAGPAVKPTGADIATPIELKGSGFLRYSLAVSSLWVIVEYLQTVGVFGMNWGELAVCLVRLPVSLQANTLWGMWGLSFALAMVNVGVGEFLALALSATASQELHGQTMLQKLRSISGCCGDSSEKQHNCRWKHWRNVTGTLWIFILLFGIVRLWGAPSVVPYSKDGVQASGATGDHNTTGAKEQVWGLVQLSLDQDRRWNPDFANDNFSELMKASGKAIEQGAQVVAWPETSVPYRGLLESKVAQRIMERSINERQAWYVVGSIERDLSDKTMLNAMSVWDKAGHLKDRYDKFNIVPFGEYLPARQYWPSWFPGVNLVMNYKPGRGVYPVEVDNTKVGILICFESMCTWVARRHVLNGAQVLFVPTNDVWFKESVELPGHFDMDIMRAVELARPIMQVGNSGVSGFADKYGRVKQESKINANVVLVDTVEPATGLTLYAKIGDWVVWAFVLICGAAVFKLSGSTDAESAAVESAASVTVT